MQRRTFKYRLRPTKRQERLLHQTLNACRWVYNKTLEVRKTAWEEFHTSLSFSATNKLLTQWKDDQPWLRQAHSQVLQNA